MNPNQPGTRRSFLKGALATPLLLVGPAALAHAKSRPEGTDVGPSTTSQPYLVPSITGAKTVSILTVGDSVQGYRMVGIPDGLGAFISGHNQFTLLMNHEITTGAPGIVRAHGSSGAFVSRWTINTETLKVVKGQDHTPAADKVFQWDASASKYVAGTTQWQRLCSADLAAESAYSAHGLGTRDRILLNGEEVADGRAWARVASGPHTGEAWQLPRLGRLAFENAVACPYPQQKTVVALLDDSNLSTSPTPASGSPSEVYFYIGTKTGRGHPVERAGLTNGLLHGLTISVDGQPVTEESDQFGLGSAATGYIGEGRFGLFNMGDVSALSAADIESASIAGGVARLQRCEDGAWDPRENRNNDFYFVTTASANNNCRLWRLSFDDIRDPEQGGTIEILLRGDEGHKMLDNVTIDRLGRILMDEDPGNSTRISKIWLYAIDTRELIQVAGHNPKYFDGSTPNNPDFITEDEESSGIIDAAAILGDGWFLLDVQAHKASADPELVEGGQLLALYVDPGVGLVCHDDRRDGDDDDHRSR